MRTLNRLLLAGLSVSIFCRGYRDHKARRLREEAIPLARHAHRNALVI
jgi:hypothetical protein